MKSLQTALTMIRRSPYQAIIAITMLAVTSYIAFSYSLLLLGINTILKDLQSKPKVIAFYELGAEPKVLEETKQIMEKKEYVQEVVVLTQQDALELYQQDNQDDPLLLELVSADILPASIEVSGFEVGSLEQIKKDLESLDGIDDVVFQEDVAASLQTWTNTITSLGLELIGILGFTSFLTIMTVISLKINQQRKSIQIMRLLGATKSYVKLPFIAEGMIYGTVGALAGWGLMYARLLYLTPQLQQFLGTLVSLPLPLEILVQQLLAGALIASLLGGFAGLVAASRLMKGV